MKITQATLREMIAEAIEARLNEVEEAASWAGPLIAMISPVLKPFPSPMIIPLANNDGKSTLKYITKKPIPITNIVRIQFVFLPQRSIMEPLSGNMADEQKNAADVIHAISDNGKLSDKPVNGIIK